MTSRKLFRDIAVAIAPAFIFYLSVLLLSGRAGIESTLVLRDLMQTCDLPIWVGMLSNFGILLWASTAAISLFSSLSGVVKQRHFRQMLLLGGLFSLLLCLDDLFLIHDLNQINQDILYPTYIILTLIIVIKYRPQISMINGYSFLLTTLLLGLSVITDIFQDFFPIDYTTVQIFEEGFKFLGISAWLYFWSKASIYAIKM